MNKKSQIINLMKLSLGDKTNFAVKIVNTDNNTEEIIVIPHDSLKEKIKYYENVYNDNMELIHYTAIKIVACMPFKSCSSIEGLMI